MYEPKFSLGKMRGSKTSLWVEMPNGESYNIWDVNPDQLSMDVLKAVTSAFMRGIEAHRQILNSNDFISPPSMSDWIETDKG